MQQVESFRARSVAHRLGVGLAVLALLASSCGPTSAAPSSSAAAPAPRATAGSGAASPPATVPRERVRLAYSSIAGVAAIPVIAQERGFFAANGLDAEVTYIASGTTAVQALISGELSFLVGGTEAIINAEAGGADLKIFAGLVNTVPFSLLVRPEITTPEGLHGQRLGVTRLGSATDYALRAALAGWNLEPGRDVFIVQMGGIPEIRAGLESGAIAGGTLSLPTLAQARQAGFRELADLAALGIAYQTTSVATTERVLRERPRVVEGVVRALAEGIHVIKTDRTASLATFRALVQDADEQVLDETYERYGQKYIQQIPEPSREGIAAVYQGLASDPRVAALHLDDLIDDRVVRGLEAEGYFTRLYPRS